MNLNDAELAVLESGMQRIGVFFRLATTPVVRLWLGIGNIEPGVNVFDLAGATYQGFGELQNVPEFNQMINGAAQRVEFSLSGVSGDVLALASSGDAEDVKGKAVAVGLGIFSPTWALLGSVKWFANYTADYLSVEQAATDDPLQQIVRTVKLSCGSLMTGRRRPSFSYLSDQDQQARSPGDLFCSLVGKFPLGFNKAWPVFPPPAD
ncbi:hypothetical protein [Bradyrhizobium sp. 18]|uniref:hypothetical protein n=1 Tax=Bradyrhizobium sp. 18 TaxID=2782657 RepID=UPI001FF99F3B|nr:hypothetical protein [Bradyrhizobium sp. 18]MCK1503857.1 hypothetical protein [Bradyrhizobium sp. 18]